jgi:hypothetical protein
VGISTSFAGLAGSLGTVMMGKPENWTFEIVGVRTELEWSVR